MAEQKETSMLERLGKILDEDREIAWDRVMGYGWREKWPKMGRQGHEVAKDGKGEA